MNNTQVVVGQIVSEVLKRLRAFEEEPYVPIGVSNRHVHLCQEDLDILFGKGYKLTNWKPLMQPGQYASKETVTIIGPKGAIEDVRILGPVRKETQVEISLSDGFKLGIKAPVRESGKIAGTPGVILKGPKGEVKKDSGVIVALRHIHMPPDFARKYGLQDKEMVNVEVQGIRKLLYRNVLVRVSDAFVPEMHLDMDEANAAGVGNRDLVKILKG